MPRPGPVRHARSTPRSRPGPVIAITARGIRSHGVRFLLSIAAVVLGTTFVVGSFTFRDLLSSSIERTVASTLTADVYVEAPDTGGDTPHSTGRIPTTIADDLAGVDGVEAAIPETTGVIALIDADGTVVDTGMGPNAAVTPERDPTTRLATGTWPGPGEIVLEESAARAAALTTGDGTTVVINGTPREVRVTGEFTVPSLAVGSVLVGIDQDTAATEYAPDGTVARIAVHASPGTGPDALLTRVEATLDPQTATAVTGAALRAEASEDIERRLGFIRTFLVMFGAAALIAGAFVIANTFAMTVRERVREFAVLRAVGTPSWKILASVLTPALGIGIVGAAIGTVLGNRAVLGIRAALAAWGMPLPGELVLSVENVIAGLVLGTLVSLAAALVPALRAARTPPVEAMRADALPTGHGRRAALGAVVILIGAASLAAASTTGSTHEGWLSRSPIGSLDPENLLLAGAGLLIGGVLLVAPSITRPMVTALAAPLAGGALGRLARGNLARDARRTANTAGGLLVGMALVAFTGVVAESTRESLRSITENEVRADLIVGSATGLVPLDAIDTIRSTTGVEAVDTLRRATATVADAATSRAVTIAGIAPEAFDRSLSPLVVAGVPATALAANEAVVTATAATDQDWDIGTRLDVGPPDAPAALTVGAIVDSNLLAAEVVVPDTQFDAVVPEPERLVSTAYVTGTGDIASLRTTLLDALDPYLVLSVRDRAEAATAYAESVNEIVSVLYAVLALSVLIALLGIVNTLALSVIERTREIGLMRAVGVGARQLAVVIALEAVLTAVHGTILGIATGLGVSAAVPGALADRGMTTLAIPWGDLGVIVAVAVVIGLVASVGPAWRATRIPVLTAVATD